jgi:cytosine/adenosine deaminase-related metal-dependent hydrolase
VQLICTEAHRLGMNVTGHVPQALTTAQGIEAGMDQINPSQLRLSNAACSWRGHESDGLQLHRLHRDNGTIEAGKRADLILVNETH